MPTCRIPDALERRNRRSYFLTKISAIAGQPAIVCRAAGNRKKLPRTLDNAEVDTTSNIFPTAILDTNVVLDWLVFRNPSISTLIAAVRNGQICWIATDAMRDELHYVLKRGQLTAWRPDPVNIWAHWDRYCTSRSTPAPRHAGRLRCSDPDDQKFVDLAQEGAAWLLTRDRALLRLAPRLRAHGVRTLTPEAWTLAAGHGQMAGSP